MACREVVRVFLTVPLFGYLGMQQTKMPLELIITRVN